MKYNFKKYFLLFCATLLLLSGCSKVDTNQKLEDKKTIIIGLDDTFAPMGFKDENGEFVGFDIDLATEIIEKRLDKKVEFKSINWDSKEAELRNGNIDLIWNGLSITDDRKKNMAFTDEYLSNAQGIAFDSDNSFNKISKLSDLNSKTIAVQLDSSGQAALEKYIEDTGSSIEIKKYEDTTLAFTDLDLGRVDAVVSDQIFIEYYISQNKDKGIQINPNVFFENAVEGYGVGMSPKNKSFAKVLNKELKKVKEDGTMKKLKKEWFATK